MDADTQAQRESGPVLTVPTATDPTDMATEDSATVSEAMVATATGECRSLSDQGLNLLHSKCCKLFDHLLVNHLT